MLAFLASPQALLSKRTVSPVNSQPLPFLINIFNTSFCAYILSLVVRIFGPSPWTFQSTVPGAKINECYTRYLQTHFCWRYIDTLEGPSRVPSLVKSTQNRKFKHNGFSTTSGSFKQQRFNLSSNKISPLNYRLWPMIDVSKRQL